MSEYEVRRAKNYFEYANSRIDQQKLPLFSSGFTMPSVYGRRSTAASTTQNGLGSVGEDIRPSTIENRGITNLDGTMTNILVSTVNRKDTLPSRPFDEDQTMLNVSAADVISEINRTVDFGPHEPHMMGPNNISAAGVNNSQELPPFAGEDTQHVSAEKRETTHIMPYSWQLPGTASDDGSFWTNGYTQNDVRKTTDNQGTFSSSRSQSGLGQTVQVGGSTSSFSEFSSSARINAGSTASNDTSSTISPNGNTSPKQASSMSDQNSLTGYTGNTATLDGDRTARRISSTTVEGANTPKEITKKVEKNGESTAGTNRKTGEQAVADGLTDDLLNSVWNAVPPGSDSIKSSKVGKAPLRGGGSGIITSSAKYRSSSSVPPSPNATEKMASPATVITAVADYRGSVPSASSGVTENLSGQTTSIHTGSSNSLLDTVPKPSGTPDDHTDSVLHPMWDAVPTGSDSLRDPPSNKSTTRPGTVLKSTVRNNVITSPTIANYRGTLDDQTDTLLDSVWDAVPPGSDSLHYPLSNQSRVQAGNVSKPTIGDNVITSVANYRGSSLSSPYQKTVSGRPIVTSIATYKGYTLPATAESVDRPPPLLQPTTAGAFSYITPLTTAPSGFESAYYTPTPTPLVIPVTSRPLKINSVLSVTSEAAQNNQNITSQALNGDKTGTGAESMTSTSGATGRAFKSTHPSISQSPVSISVITACDKSASVEFQGNPMYEAIMSSLRNSSDAPVGPTTGISINAGLGVSSGTEDSFGEVSGSQWDMAPSSAGSQTVIAKPVYSTDAYYIYETADKPVFIKFSKYNIVVEVRPNGHTEILGRMAKTKVL